MDRRRISATRRYWFLLHAGASFCYMWALASSCVEHHRQSPGVLRRINPHACSNLPNHWAERSPVAGSGLLLAQRPGTHLRTRGSKVPLLAKGSSRSCGPAACPKHCQRRAEVNETNRWGDLKDCFLSRAGIALQPTLRFCDKALQA